jgi:hypothetical protein
MTAHTMQPQAAISSGPESELLNFAQEMARSGFVTANAIDFWQSHDSQYPLLSRVALDLVAAPASQAYTERIFSVCGDLTAGKRNRLTTSLECRVFLKVNAKLM